jgi:hypothetical protein
MLERLLGRSMGLGDILRDDRFEVIGLLPYSGLDV